ncbi:MAG TPA: hypothetical protein DEP08_01550 [Candidatus Jacksonbacteria bacterium]|nr:hypothetical protein [Candidatus Jacksonbacteria bacterium]
MQNTDCRVKLAYFINIDNGEIGGAEYHVIDLASRLDTTRFEIHAISTDENYLAHFPKYITTHCIKDTSPEYTLQFPKNLYFILKKIKPHILHSHKLKASVWGSIVGFFAKIPVRITTTHGSPLQWQVPICRKAFNSLFNTVASNLFATWIIAVCKTEALIKQKRESISKRKISVIYHSLPLPPYELDKKTNKSSEIVIGTVARLSTEKGHEYLIRALPAILQKYQNIKFVFVGNGPLKNSLERLAKKMQVNAYIEFVGTVERNHVSYYLNTFDIFILPSLWESLPYSLLEAIAAGIPVIAADVGGNKEIITNKKTGLLIKSKSSIAIAEAILYLLNNKTIRQELAEMGQRLVRQHFSGDRMIQQHTQLYLQLVEKYLY